MFQLKELKHLDLSGCLESRCLPDSIGLVTTQDISIGGVPQIGKSTNGVQKTSKLGGTIFIRLFQVAVFTLFNCELVTTQDILITVVTNWKIYQ
jgi:hypothetical protein